MEIDRILFSAHGETLASETKTVKILRFEVPAGVEALELGFDYGPRTSTDVAVNLPLVEAAIELHTRRRRGILPAEEIARHRRVLAIDDRAKSLNHLMNVVLIDPAGTWRGRWDRNPSSTKGALTVGRTFASKGFVAGEIPEGTWQLALECHGVYGAKVEWDATVRRGDDAPQDEPEEAPVTRPAQKREGPGWYFGEMHSHSVHSDGKWSVATLAAHAADVGADFLCLTDHNTMSGHREKAEWPVTLVRGIELTTFAGHHPIYGIHETLPWHENGRVLPLEVTGKRARSQGGIVGVAHPFVPGDPLCTGCRMQAGLDPRTFDTMEVWYRRWQSPGADNEAAYELWNAYWRAGHRITALGARDWHGAEQTGPFPGDMPFTGIYAERNDEAGILEGLRKGKVIVSSGPILEIDLVATSAGAGGACASIGETLEAPGPADAVVRTTRLLGPASPDDAADAADAADASELRLFRNGELVFSGSISGDGSVTFEGLATEPGYYRAELWQGGTPRAFTNHVVRR